MRTMKILYIHTITIFFLLLFLPGFVYGQQSVSRAESVAGVVSVHVAELAERGDSLYLEIEYRVFGQALNSRQSWAVYPQLVCPDADSLRIRNFPYVLINGRIKEKHYRRKKSFGDKELLSNPAYFKTDIPKHSDTLLRYVVQVPFESWMSHASLNIQQLLLSSAGKRQAFIINRAGEVKLSPREPYKVLPKVNFIVPERETHKMRNVQGQAYLDFSAGRSVIYVNFRRNPEELGKIADMLVKVLDNPDTQITNLYIEGYASPEGNYVLNERLARERASALKDYMIRAFNLDRNLFKVSSIGEDWEGFRMQVTDGLFSQSNKEKILAIIDSNDALDVKKRNLRALGSLWRVMMNEIFPLLRRVEYRIDFSVKDYTLEESRNLAAKSPEMLSQRELFMLAQVYPPGSEDRNRIFDTIHRLYPGDATATINSAAAMLLRGEDATARRYLDSVSDDPRAQNNMGVYYLKVGELDKAEECFRKASKQGVSESTHNLEEVERKRKDNELMKRYER